LKAQNLDPEYSLESGGAGGIHNPQYLKTVEAFSDWYLQHSGVVHVKAITGQVKRLNRVMHEDDASYCRIPDQRDLTAPYLLLYEMSLPFGLDLNNQINVDKSATRMIVTLKDVSSTGMREMDARANTFVPGKSTGWTWPTPSGIPLTPSGKPCGSGNRRRIYTLGEDTK